MRDRSEDGEDLGDRREGWMMGKGDRRKGDPGNGKGDGDPRNGEGDRGGYDGFADFEMSYISDIVDSAFCLGDILLSLITPLFRELGFVIFTYPFFKYLMNSPLYQLPYAFQQDKRGMREPGFIPFPDF